MAPIECALLLVYEALMHSTLVFNVDWITKNLIIIPSIFHVCRFADARTSSPTELYIIIFRLLFYINTYFINRTIYVNLFFQIIKWSVRQEKWHSNSNYVGFPCSLHGRHFDIRTGMRARCGGNADGNGVPVVGDGVIYECAWFMAWGWNAIMHSFNTKRVASLTLVMQSSSHALLWHCAAVLLFSFEFMSSPWILCGFR